MGKKKGRGKKNAKRSASGTMPGFDYGIDRSTAILTAPDFNDNMRQAEIIAASYGELRAPGYGPIIPCISMVARNPAPLKEAYTQFQAWMQATGPDALKVEILYSSRGYYIGFGPEYQHAIWRTVGIDQFTSPLFYGVTYIKTIDSRQPLLDRLADYSKHVFAPVMLLGAHFTGDRAEGLAPRPSEIQSITDCPQLLLFRLPIYKTKEELPEFSGLRVMASRPHKNASNEAQKQYEQQVLAPDTIFRLRERRITALMPVTVHMLRTYAPLEAKLAAFEEQGLTRWQIEQAIVNQRIWSQAAPKLRARFQNANDLYRAVESFAEIDDPNWDAIADDTDEILSQALRDARLLLRKVGAKAPDTLEACQKELAARGYLVTKSSA